jgi:2-methylisocitrate lyase-like PEP mutase family enzyme
MESGMTSQRDKGEAFRALHSSGAFVIPNPWDEGSARVLEGLGAKALATTSSGLAQAIGRLDGQVTLAEKLEHCAALARVTGIPVSADLENGFADAPEDVAETIRKVAATGVVGGSIEDYSAATGIYELSLAVDRIAAAARAARSLDFPFTLTARAENLLRGVDNLDDTIARLRAYAEAGADVLYAPGLTSLDDVRRVVAAVDGPVNVLAPFLRGVTVDQIAATGARRISIGGALANVALGATIAAARALLDEGRFDWLVGSAKRADVQQLLGPRR